MRTKHKSCKYLVKTRGASLGSETGTHSTALSVKFSIPEKSDLRLVCIYDRRRRTVAADVKLVKLAQVCGGSDPFF